MPWLLQAAHRNGVRSVVVGSVDTDELTIVVPHTSHKAVDAMVRDLGGTVTERHRREAGRTQGLTLSTPFGNAHVYYALNGKSYRDLSSDHASRSVRFANTNGTVSQRVTIDAGNATAGAFAAVSPSLRPDSVRPASLDGLRLRSHGDLGTHW